MGFCDIVGVVGRGAGLVVVTGRLVVVLRVAVFLVVVRVVVDGFFVAGFRVVVARVDDGRVVDFLAVVRVAGFLVVVFLEGLVLAAEILARRVARPSIDLFLSIVYNYSIMATKITKKQLAVLNFLEDFTEEKGYSPSYREIQEGLGLSSVSAVAEHIDNLVAKGVLKKVPGAARSLEVLDYKHEETVKLFKAKLIDCSEEDAIILKSAAEVLGLDLG